MTHTWLDAIGECQLYGGWLVHITGLREYNCLLKYGISQGFENFYWTDGKNIKFAMKSTHSSETEKKDRTGKIG